MPNRNGMGPQGKGPRTGRGLGKCKAKSVKKKTAKVKKLKVNKN